MKFKPKYSVSYNGIWYYAGEVIEILSADAEELKQHGEIIEDEPNKTVEMKPSSKTNTRQKKN